MASDLTASKISVSPSFFNWIKTKMIFYRISELMLQGSFSGAISRYSRIFFERNRIKIPGVRKKSHAEFFSFRAVKFLFAHAVHFETIGLFCLTGF